MKKAILWGIAALAIFASCSKVETIEQQKEINFEVANRIQTKAEGVKYANGPFGTYAWFNGTDEFMVNEKVDEVSGAWKTVDHTFYWPKTGYIEFVSYSPFQGTSNTAGTVPVITKDNISYDNVTIDNVDYMYADKVKCSENVNEITDNAGGGTDSGYEGVPTLFRHALAKLAFVVKAPFLTYTDPATNTPTTWEMTLNSAKLSGIYNQGSCNLSLNSDGKSWVRPTGNVWTPSTGATTYDEQELVTSPITIGTDAQSLDALTNAFVMPQTFDGNQKLTINITIKTTLSNGKEITETYEKVIDLSDGITAIEMNKNMVYTISVKPVKSIDPNNNDNPNDATITFDPAVADWEPITPSLTLEI